MSHAHLHVRDHNIGWGASTSVIQSFKVKTLNFKKPPGVQVLLFPSPLLHFQYNKAAVEPKEETSQLFTVVHLERFLSAPPPVLPPVGAIYYLLC